MSGERVEPGTAAPAGASRHTPHGGDSRGGAPIDEAHETTGQNFAGVSGPGASRYRGLPVVFLSGPDATPRPCPFLMSVDDVAAFFRLADSRTKFPAKTIERYRRLGLKSIRVGRRRWFTLPDVLDFLDRQQARLRWIR